MSNNFIIQKVGNKKPLSYGGERGCENKLKMLGRTLSLDFDA